MKRITKRLITLILSMALITQLACVSDPFGPLRLAMGAATPLISILVARGTITQTQADTYKTAFTNGIDSIQGLSDDWKVAVTGPQKLAAVIRAETRWTAIAAGGAFGNAPPQIFDAISIINSILATVVAFYGGTPSHNPGATNLKNEKELKAYVDQRTKQLKATLQPK